MRVSEYAENAPIDTPATNADRAQQLNLTAPASQSYNTMGIFGFEVARPVDRVQTRTAYPTTIHFIPSLK
ncbi:hypothetical protein VDGE_30575 [Verticillium dahliae]|uniref:Uncharacterized protein n=1 Tax=Verticillium dahliae TaxID=27337 RepID=A0A444RZB2_VERDA|nr:hypothetical protein VDGE_30575 [Verticillium dahliae]